MKTRLGDAAIETRRFGERLRLSHKLFKRFKKVPDKKSKSSNTASSIKLGDLLVDDSGPNLIPPLQPDSDCPPSLSPPTLEECNRTDVGPERNKPESAVVRWRVCDERGQTSAPLVTTKFITQDQNQGYSGQCFMHSSMSHFPVNTDMIKQSTVLSELIVSPVRAVEKELVHPIVNFGELGPIRYTAYMCP
ncbi:hypothetical protein pipiens_019070 [Culex pipiens pipiens]|uniref:Uncharacterized protein n=1 Tax=Culex pipiens pipiens TaxID=38569 RepID=A0ABD1DWQ6_CULPP